eukprot:gene8244-9126_t
MDNFDYLRQAADNEKKSSGTRHGTDSVLLPMSRNVSNESLLRTLVTRPSTSSSSSTEQETNIFYTDRLIRYSVCLFFGIIPKLFHNHRRKAYSMFLSIIIVLLQWYSVAGYIYCTDMFWSTTTTKMQNTTANGTVMGVTAKGNTVSRPALNYLPKIPIETLLLLLGLAASGAVTVSIAVYYFYSSKNIFSTRETKFSLVPLINLNEENFDDSPIDSLEAVVDLPRNDWLVTNILFMMGMLSVCFVFGTDFGTDTLFDFKGIRAFLKHTTITNQAIYALAVAVLFWGFFATVCACCIFHIMSRQIIALISQTERLVVECTTTRLQFFKLHERMICFTERMIKKFELWFAIHNIMFLLLLAAMIFEWVSFMKNSNYEHNILLSQMAGTLLICYKFAFPFFSASRVTVRLVNFYLKIARNNQFENMPELLLFPNHFGFEVFGLRITPNVAIVVFLSSFVGLLKFFTTGI